jgi:hypothetical protein
MDKEEKRLAELGKLETLTDAEMQELVRLRPSGTFKTGPNLLTLGVVDLEQAFLNYKEGAARSHHAYSAGCFIEVISLRLQHMDFWLRSFWVARNHKGKIFDAADKRTFGVLVTDCEKLGFEFSLVERMRSFNSARVSSIHKYLLGAIRYEDLKPVCDAHKGLDADVGGYVREQIGIPWTI